MIKSIHDMNLRTLDLNLLRVFDALLTERNVTRAASRMDLSQPAVSNALARLRRALDDPLFVRTPRGMIPTSRAEQLEMPVREALMALERAMAPPAEFDPATATHTFVLAATDYIEMVLLPPLVRRLAAMGPGIVIRVLSKEEGINVAQSLTSGKVDAALGYFPNPEPYLHIRKLFDERFLCLVRDRHPKVKHRLTLKQFLALDHVLVSTRGGGLRGVVDDYLTEQGMSRRVALSIPHFLIAPFVVANSDYVVTLAERVAHTFMGLLPLRSFPPPLELPGFSAHLVWHKRTHDNPAHRWLRHQFIELGRRV